LHEVRGLSVLECRTVRDGRTVRGPIVDGLLLRVEYWRFVVVFQTVCRSSWTVRRALADGPPRGRRQSAR
jgi:hypothetical protein